MPPGRRPGQRQALRAEAAEAAGYGVAFHFQFLDPAPQRLDLGARRGQFGAERYADSYRVWPGPNSNTFVAYVLRSVPELRADLPATAIGKDYLGAGFVAKSPSGTGVQFNLFGLFGALAGVEEGLEINVLGLTFGVDPLDLALKLPLVGRLGFGNATAGGAE